jgi:cytochrome P450
MFSILLCILGIIILIIIVIIYFKLIRPEKRVYDIFRAQGINGEPFVPLIGQISQLKRSREADMMMVYFEELAKKYGHVFLFCFGPIVRLVINEPDLLADVLSRNNAQNYIKPPMATAVFKPIIGTHNLLIGEGDEHERARRMLNPAFHHTNLKSMISIIADRTAKTIERIFTKINSHEEPVDLQILFNTLTLSIIVSSAFGSDLETNANSKDVMSRVFVQVLDAVVYRSLRMIIQIPFLSKLPFWKKDVVDNGARVIAEFVDQIIIDRRQGRTTSMSDGPDLLDLLLSAVDTEGQSFTDQEIKEQALTFVLAGSETTGNLMVWLSYILMTHDNVLQACREEIDRVLSNDTEFTNEKLAELVICEAVINETLRLYPPAPFFVRHCVHEHTIGTEHKLHIPVGTSIFVNSYVLHRRSDLWPRPLEFDYTRWLRDPKKGLKPKLTHPFAYLPFAAGPRNCIGQNFALLEAKIMLAMFVQRCDFKLIPGQKIVPEVKITLKTKYGLWANISRRQI